jgi:hypothetical protein
MNTNSTKVRFIDLYNKSDQDGSFVQIFSAGNNCGYPSVINPITEKIPLKHREPNIIDNIKPNCYYFDYSSASISMDLKPANIKPGLNTILIGGPEFDGGATVAVVSD